MPEIIWDDKFAKKLLNLDGSNHIKGDEERLQGELARLDLFESIVLVVFIHARRCSTTGKFLKRSNFLKLLLSVDGTTQALVIPISNQQAAGV